jgi:tetratricopeptide (TPR) repeat protein
VPRTQQTVESGSKDFGSRLRALRRARGLKQQDLAQGRYSAAYISMLESGRTRASMKALEHIASKLTVSVAELLGGGPQPDEVEARLAVAKALVAAQDADRALEVLRVVGDGALSPFQQLTRLRLEGRAQLQRRAPKDALVPLTRALALAQHLGDKAEIAHVRNQLGLCCYYTYAYHEALQHHLAALESVQRGEVRDALLEFRVLSNLGNTYTMLGEHPAAIGYYERALAMARDVVDQERLAGVHAGLAFAYSKQEDYDAAIRHARESLTLYEQIGAKRTVPEVMNNLAYLYGKIGNRARADELLQQALEQARVAENRFAIPHLLLSRAELFLQTDPDRARGLGREALAAAEAVEQREAILSSRLFLAGLEPDVARARTAFEQCLALARASVPERARRVLEAWSEWEELRGEARRAAKLAREALHT